MTYVLDVWCMIDEEDIGNELELTADDEIYCPTTGKVYTGTLIVKDLKEVGIREEPSERQL